MSSLFRRFRAACITIVAALTVIGTMPAASAAEIVVFAAASLKEALDDAVNAYENKSGVAVKISYAASSTLAKQIESGAPADIFISADLDWMDYLLERRFRDEALTSAAQAATIILDGVRANRWRILVGPDAHKIDEMVRQSPEWAYDVAFFDEFARAAGWTERLFLENPELHPPN